MNHYRKTHQKYLSRRRGDVCPFCNPKILTSAVFQNEFVYIVPNLTQYDLWELHDVLDHLMIIPKRHVEALEELTAAEKLAIMDQAAEYESKGYNIYARGKGFIRRSVKHQHTHLIRASNKQPRLALFLKSPYYLFKK